MSPPPPKKTVSFLELATARSLRLWLMVLVLVLTFEGVARKLNIAGTNVPLFVLKDVIVLIIGLYLPRMRRPPAIDFLLVAYLGVIVLFLPVIALTALHDPLLALFGAKQYLLYPLVGIAVFFAFHNLDLTYVVRFFRWSSLLIIPTFIVAMIQMRLPAGHWLNLSVAGDSLDGFAAAGKLRVSSTFSFVAQYVCFLNAEFFMLVIALNRTRDLNFFWKVVYFSLIPILVISAYLTGSRGAVVGATAVLAIASLLSLMKFQSGSTIRLLAIALGLAVFIPVAHYYLPDEFAAYYERESGHLVGVSNDNFARVYNSLFNWAGNAFTGPFFGNGLGIMSNGSEIFSDYASRMRDMSGWTETDAATTLYEGGIYLVVVWYGFRYYIIYQTTRRFLSGVHQELSLPGSICQAIIIIVGVTGTLGIQPPLAIWWWMAVGTSLVLWWKCVEPKRDEEGQAVSGAPPPVKKLRGRSAYADRLHGGR